MGNNKILYIAGFLTLSVLLLLSFAYSTTNDRSGKLLSNHDVDELGIRAKKIDVALAEIIKSKKRLKIEDIKKNPFQPVYSERTATEQAEDINGEEPPALFRLSGILLGIGASFAVINNEVKTEEEYVGEYRIVKITGDSVVLQNKNEIFTIGMENAYTRETEREDGTK